jgi:hypothetical protein
MELWYSFTMEGFDQIPAEETEKNLFETSRQMGGRYTTHIQKLIGKTSQVGEMKLNDLEKSGNEYFKPQSERFKASAGTAETLLTQLFPNGLLPEDFLDSSKYELLQPSEGIFVLEIDEELIQQILPNATAIAVKIKNGISFVMIPDYKNESINEKIQNENIPHEVHHLFWKGVMDAGVLDRKETDPDFESAFAMYQDELIARMCSNGELAGYSHISLLGPEAKKDFQEKHPEKFEKILNTVIELNDFLFKLSAEMRVRNVTGESLIGVTIKAQSFLELKINLEKCRNYILTQPIINPDKPVSSGWDFI